MSVVFLNYMQKLVNYSYPAESQIIYIYCVLSLLLLIWDSNDMKSPKLSIDSSTSWIIVSYCVNISSLSGWISCSILLKSWRIPTLHDVTSCYEGNRVVESCSVISNKTLTSNQSFWLLMSSDFMLSRKTLLSFELCTVKIASNRWSV